MNAPFRKIWTQEEFFAWEGHAEGRYEFDGLEPVAMTGGTFGHSLIMGNLHAALRRALRDTGCRMPGPDAGIATVGKAVRYPDALVTCARVPMGALTVPDVVAVFEVVSPGSSRMDRIVKVREYAAVPTILHYVILESTGAGLTVFGRTEGTAAWTASTLLSEDSLRLSDLGIELPVAELYEGVEFGGEQPPTLPAPS